MTEKQKRDAGILYECYGEQLTKELLECKAKCFAYNNTNPSDRPLKKKMIKEIIDVKGSVVVESPFYCDYGYNIHAGNAFYANHGLVILDCNTVTFGENVFIGPNCSFYTAGHPIDYERRNIGLEFAKPIKVGSNVWFGGNVVVLPGVTIGDNVVIGAGSVIAKDIPGNVVAHGNPCKVVRPITDKDKETTW